MPCKILFFFLFLSFFIIPQKIIEYSDYIIASGENIGIKLNATGILVIGTYEIENSNPAKDAGIEKGDIITYRKNEHDILMKTRNGYFMNEDGSYKSEFFDILNNLKERLEYAKSNTSIPKLPDFKKVQDFVMEINRKVVQNN